MFTEGASRKLQVYFGLACVNEKARSAYEFIAILSMLAGGLLLPQARKRFDARV